VKSVLAFLILSSVSTVSLMAADVVVPRKAPELAFTIPGEGEKLLSQYRGKVVALEFIMTTCPHCQAASHDMTKYQEEFGKRGLQVIDLAINALDGMGGPSEAVEMVTRFKSNFQVGFPVGYLPRVQMMTFMGFTPADRMVVPQLALIDRKGVIHYQTPAISGPQWESVMKEPFLRQHLEELLALGNTTSTPHSKSKMVASAAQK
jgi:thiol-disulfide isomerase/thioredoxin